MSSYHITENGAKPCSTTPERCPITKDTGDKHYSNFQEAQKEYENKMVYDFSVDSVKASKPSQYVQPLTIPSVKNIDENIHSIKKDIKEIFNDDLNPETEEYLRSFMSGEIPNKIPDELTDRKGDRGMFLASSMIHSASLDSGYYAKITKKFAAGLAEKIGKDSTILDPMAGKGYFVKAMREQGIKTIGSDDMSWKTAQTEEASEIENISAVDSLRKNGNRISHLVISWAPYESDIDNTLYQTVKNEYPHITIINIGEGMGGCTGSEKLWDNLDEDQENDLINMDSRNQCGYETTSILHDYLTFVKINK